MKTSRLSRTVGIGFLFAVLLLVVSPPIGVLVIAVAECKGSLWTMISSFYTGLISDPQSTGVLNSILLATCVALLATGMGFVSALNWWFESRRRTLLEIYFLIGTFPPAIYCLALMQIWRAFGQQESSHILLVISQTCWAIPFCTVIIMVGIGQVETDVISAAFELAGSRFVVLARIVIPLTVPAIVSSFSVAFFLSFNDYVRAFYLSGSTQLVSKYVYGKMASGADLTTYAIGGTIVLAALSLSCVVLLGSWLTSRANNKKLDLKVR